MSDTSSITTSGRSTMKVLLVDDDDFQVKLITAALKGLGITNVVASLSGEDALRKLTGKHGFNLMVLDLYMPGMDGFKFMESLAASGYAGSLIIASGQSDDVIHAASLVAKLRRFTLLGTIAKPVGRAALSELISKMGV